MDLVGSGIKFRASVFRILHCCFCVFSALSFAGCAAYKLPETQSRAKKTDIPAPHETSALIENLLAYRGTNLLALSTEDRQRIDALADRLRDRVYKPLFVCEVANNAGMTNIVYIEGDYPWPVPANRHLRFSVMHRQSVDLFCTQFKIGSRSLPYEVQVVRSAGGDLLRLFTVSGLVRRRPESAEADEIIDERSRHILTFKFVQHPWLSRLSKPVFVSATRQNDEKDVTEIWKKGGIIKGIGANP